MAVQGQLQAVLRRRKTTYRVYREHALRLMLFVKHEAHPCAQVIPVHGVAFLAYLAAGPWVVDYDILAFWIIFVRRGPL